MQYFHLNTPVSVQLHILGDTQRVQLGTTTTTARQKCDRTFSLSNVLKASIASFLFLKWYSFFGGGASSSLSELKQQMLNS